MVFVLLISFSVFGLIVYFLDSKGFWDWDLLKILINRGTIALLLSAAILFGCYLYLLYLSEYLGDSTLEELLDLIISIPLFFPFVLGFTSGEEYGYFALGLELILMTLFLRLFISKRWIEKVQNWVGDFFTKVKPH